MYRASRANRSIRPTKVMLYCTGFKFGICPQKHREHNFYKIQKGHVNAFYKIIQ